MLSFRLGKNFVDGYRLKPEPFGFGALGKTTFYRTYARPLDENTLETWADTCERIINGMYSIQKDYCVDHGRRWSDEKAQASACEAYDRLFNLKWSPPGRGLFHMGAPSIHERGMVEASLNCAFISTEPIVEHRGSLFSWVMEMLMLGVGVGFDVKGAGKLRVVKPSEYNYVFVIDDTRESWAESVGALVNSYLPSNSTLEPSVVFDYSRIRPRGALIKGFGGVASGPAPLMEMHEKIRAILDARDGNMISGRDITDIMNMIGVVVVAGNVRRSSQIALGNKDDSEFLNLKNYNVNPERAAWGWASNNSVYASLGMDYTELADRILHNGEPGMVWMENANRFARMNGVIDARDNGTGVNPCGEQVLAGYSTAGLGGELCTLVELYPTHHTDIYDFMRSIKFAYLYGKTVTLLNEKIKYPGTRQIMLDNRRIGLSMTGITQFVAERGIGELVKWADAGYKYVRHYDEHYSQWFGINESVRVTTVKPSGSVSLVAGVTPGVHYPHSEYYIRRVRLSEDSHLAERLRIAGIDVEPDLFSPNTVVASFPVHAGEGVQGVKDVSMWQQLQIASVMQRFWSDNSVSVTVSVNPKHNTVKEVADALSLYQYSLKSVSMLPEVDGGAYAQMPYEKVNKEKYEKMAARFDASKLNDMNKLNLVGAKAMDMYCDGDACEIRPTLKQD